MTGTRPPRRRPERTASRRARVHVLLGTALGAAVLLATAAVPGAPVRAATAQDAAVQQDTASAATPWAGNTPNITGGTDYHLDATGGSDTGDGTSPETAWQTLAKAGSVTFEPGDRLLLKGGETWSDGQLWPKGSGTAERPIVLDAYGDESAGLPAIAANGTTPSPFRADGSKNPDTVGLTGAVVLRNQQYWHIGHLDVSNDDDQATDITTGSVVRDGISVSINADRFAPGENTIMRGIRVTDVHAHHIDGPSTWQKMFYGGINFQVFGEKQYGEYPEAAHYFQDVRIERNTFDQVELNAVQFGFNWFGDAQGQVDEAGKFHEGWEQLWIKTRDLYSRDVYIGHNYARDTGQGPFQFAGTKNLVAEYNEANGWLQRYDQVSAALYLYAGADSVMRFNEVYGGPAQQYDATPWDLEYTNFDVTYEYNYSHDNLGGWMAYMGNSGNSIARYNLSVNDNGVIFKNMLSSNYSPTYVLNNVFVYDGGILDAFHDEVLKDRVYFANNVFYNTNATTPTTFSTKPNALDLGVFANNAYFEASGTPSPTQPADAAPVNGDPKFVGNPADYARDAGVDRIRDSAKLFELRPDSPLIDAGRWNPRVGSADFFGTPVYFGDGVDIGIHEVRQGAQETAPSETEPLEEIGVDGRTNLAQGKPVAASSVRAGNAGLAPGQLTDGNPATRWAAEDAPAYPVTLDVDLGADTTFTEVGLDEHTDSSTAPRVGRFDLQRFDAGTGNWVTFASGADGIGRNKAVSGFGSVTTSKLRVALLDLLPGQSAGPTLTEIRVFGEPAPN